MIFGFMQSERAIATRCFCPPDSCSGNLAACSGIFTRSQILHGRRLGLSARHLPNPDRRQGAILQHGEMGEQVELLEDHANLAANFVECA